MANIFDQFDTQANPFDQFDQQKPGPGQILSEEQQKALTEKQRQQIYASDVPTIGPSGEIIKRPPPPQPSFGEKAMGVGEAALSAVTGATGGMAGMGYGTVKQLGKEIASGEFGTAESADRVEQEALRTAGEYTYQPKTATGQAYVKKLGDTLGELIPPVIPVVGNIDTAFVGMSLRNLRKGTKLVTSKGKPTEALRKALDKNGLVYENLSPEAKAVIPQKVTPELLGTVKSEAAKASEKALIQQIKSGSKDDALAVLKVVGNKVKPDKLGQEAINQGFDPGFVQSIKTSSPDTKRAMGEMLNTMERITKKRRLALDKRPTDVVGDEVLKRVSYIKDKANSARLKLDDVAKNELQGTKLSNQEIDVIVNRLSDSLSKIDVDLSDSMAGKPKPDYKMSMIAKDRTSQKVINDLIDLMAEGGRPDALRVHKLKRQLDTMIDFRKKSAGGLTDAGKNVLKDIRAELNNTLRAKNKTYAEVNDTLSSSLNSLEGFSKAIGPSIDVFGGNANKAIGTDLRGLLSNRKTRIKLDNALNQLDETANNLGGKFNVDYKDLSLFANGIEERFGSVAQTSFKGDIEAALKSTQQATEQGVKTTATKAAFNKAAEMADKLRGRNEFNAFKSIRDLIKESEYE